MFEVGHGSRWEQIQLVEGLRNPSFLCVHPTQPVLYAVHGDFEEISVFSIGAKGRLEKQQEKWTGGRNPVHLAVTLSGRWLLVANYATGNVVSMPVAADGQLGGAVCALALEGQPGPDPQQHGSHPHQVCISPDGRHIFVPDKGLDAVFALAIDEQTGKLTVSGGTQFGPGSGPRHMAFQPERRLAYVVGELDRSLNVLSWDGAGLSLISRVSTVPPGWTTGSAAGIVVSPDASRVWVSNRGHDSIAEFKLEAGRPEGAPTWTDAGLTPRFITTAPDGRLVVAREDGHSIATLSHSHGKPCEFTDVTQTGSPVCVLFRKVEP